MVVHGLGESVVGLMGWCEGIPRCRNAASKDQILMSDSAEYLNLLYDLIIL
jgi:hypothetical protein